MDTVPTTLHAKRIKGLTEIPLESLINYGKCLLAVAGADGEISAPEWQYFEDELRAMGLPAELLEMFRAFEPGAEDLQRLLPLAFEPDQARNNRKTHRLLIYDAICMAWADGDYDAGEQRAAAEAATVLGIPPAEVAAIEGLIRLERALQETRLALFDAPPG